MSFVSEPLIGEARFLLVCGDGAPAAQLVGKLAMHCSGVAMAVAGNGRDACDALRDRAFDALLMDMGSLGDLGPVAPEAVGRLVRLADGALSIALTDAASISVAVEVMRVGAHDCLSWPVEPAALIGRIASLAQRHGKHHLLSVLARQSSTERMGVVTRLNAPPAAQPTVLPMWREEQRIIEAAIASFSGNVALAAAALELSPSTIYRKRQAWAQMNDRQRGAA